jgi:hypothetical protein
MLDDESRSKKRTIWVIVILLAFLVWFAIAFWPEISQVGTLFLSSFSVAFGKPPEVPIDPFKALHDFFVLVYDVFIGFGLFFTLWIFLISAQALLPVSNLKEVTQTARQLRLFISRAHGPAVFIHDGALIGTAKELSHVAPGVIVVDFNSAVVLESRVPAPSLMTPFENMLKDMFGIKRPPPRKVLPRACGNGLVFTKSRERIRGIVDLRRQFRIAKDVHGYTREGIELTTNVTVLFTVGQNPDILHVTYDGDRRPENLRVVSLEQLPDKRIRVVDIADELEDADRAEVHQAAMGLDPDVLLPFVMLERPSQLPQFDAERVFSAVFSTARGDQDQVLPWVDLPVRVAIDIFREMLSKHNYDTLYEPEKPDPNQFPLREFQRRFRLRVRNTGLLSYRLIFHQTSALVVGRKYNPAVLLASSPQPLNGRRVLGERGIKVISSGFGDLIPVSEAVYKQRLDNWRAQWENDTEIIRATRELEAMRIRSHARVQAQQELAETMSKLMQKKGHSQEAVAIKVMQAIETLAADPKTRQLLPGETIGLIRTIHEWLVPIKK